MHLTLPQQVHHGSLHHHHPKILRTKRHDRKQIDNVVNKIKACNKDLTETTPQNIQSKSETDYANLITIKRVDPQPAQVKDRNITTKY